jgi:hypothetical protein
MTAGTCKKRGFFKGAQTPFLRPGDSVKTVVLLGLLWPGTGICDLHVEFLVDRSGSMWTLQRGEHKFVQVAEAMEKAARELPPDVAIGLRVYPPPEQISNETDPGLRIPMEKQNRDRFAEEGRLLNPRSSGSLREEIGKALSDFPGGEDTKLLFLVCDGADTRGKSFCERPLNLATPAGLRFYAISLNVEDPVERAELDCLSQQMDGESIHLAPRDPLASTVLPIARKAYQDEVERQRRFAEEQKRIEALLSKTRLKVEFRNTLDPFFADSIQVERCLLDGQEVPIDSSARLMQGDGLLVFDMAVEEGTHKLSLRYKNWTGDKAVSSVEGILEVLVEEGKTSYVQCYPRGALFHWDFTFQRRSF